MGDIIPVQRRISSLDVSPQFDSYSKVIIHVSDDVSYEWGTDTGRTLEFDNPFGTLQMCKDVLQRLQGYQYQPYEANGVLLDPAAEIGDALNSPLVYGGIYTRTKTFGKLMKADVSAPQDEEINHEYKYESPEQREFHRETADIRASLNITNESITAEVIRASTAEGTLSSQISQQATQIAAKVSQSGGDNNSFGWTLTASGFSLYSNGTEVMRCDSGGLTVAGNISGTSGTIGGFTISPTALYTNNYSNFYEPKSSGVHLSASGLRLGSNFYVDANGNVAGTSATFNSIVINNSSMTGTFSGSGSFSGYGSFSSGGMGGGCSFGSSTVNGVLNSIGTLENRVNAIYADYINTNNLAAKIASLGSVRISTLYLNGNRLVLKTESWYDNSDNFHRIYYWGTG